MISLFNRETNKLETEQIFEEKMMNFFYLTKIGDTMNRLILSKRFLTWLYGLYQSSFLSKKAIQKAVSRYDFKLEEMELPLSEYRSFNHFFTRKLKPSARPIHQAPDAFISPADGKLFVYPIKSGLVVPVKGVQYTLDRLLKDSALAEEFDGGYCMVFRLAPVDYHRFCYIDEGSHGPILDIKGRYYSVHPMALAKNYPVFTENHRQYCVLKTENYGDVLYMEVGATFVGTIVQNHPNGCHFKKGDEKGYFQFGGSTIVLLVKKNAVAIDESILEYSEKDIETIVKYGSKVGTKVPQS